MFGRQSTREIAMRTADQFEQHQKICLDEQRQTRDAITKLVESLSKSVSDRRDQYDKLNGKAMAILLSIIGAIVFEIAKSKGML